MSQIYYITLTAVLLFLLYGVLRKSRVNIRYKQKEYQILHHKYEALQKTLVKRGQRLDTLLLAVSEAVLRVDKLGRVVGGNAQAANLFQFDKVPKLPQSMLLFYRDVEWINIYQQAIQDLPQQTSLPDMQLQGRVFLPRLAAIDDDEALLLCLDVTAYTHLQQKQQSLLENLMHDLKTPLTSLLGYARSIEAFADDKALRHEAATVIAQEAKHINDLMNSMLALNQIDLGTQQGAECDLSVVLVRIKQTLDFEMKKKNVVFNINGVPKPAFVKLSETDCYRVLMNVADNALKFSPEGSVIDCEVEERNDSFAISITDQGNGVPEKYMNRVTERFYRVDKVRGRDKAEGHGLGLAIVKEILDRDGGSLSISNVEQSGLRVSLTLPKVVF